MVLDAWIECVPNFAEGRDPSIVDAIAHTLRDVEDAHLLAQERDPDHNRSVITFIARPHAVVPAAMAMLGEAIRRIDLTRQTGEHPRMGACDVFPLIPLVGVTVEECNAVANKVAAALAHHYELPVFLYEESARTPARRALEKLRHKGPLEPDGPVVGAFEWLAAKMPSDPRWRPDYGPPRVHPTAGVTAVGTRFILLAFNVNLDTGDRRLAVRIANNIRESRGGMAGVKALPMTLAARNCVQVSMNLVDYRKTGLAEVFRAVESQAAAAGVAVRQSEFVGLVPQDAIDRAFAHFCRLGTSVPRGSITRGQTPLVLRYPLTYSGRPTGPTALELHVDAGEQSAERIAREFRKMEGLGARVMQGELVGRVGERTLRDTVRQFLKLPTLGADRVLEDVANRATGGQLPGTLLPPDPVAMLRPFLRELASDRATPGGGGVAALAAALAAACGSMVANFTVGKPKYAAVEAEVGAILDRLTALREHAMTLIADDSAAFDQVTAAWKLPALTDEQKARKENAKQAATRGAAEVPLRCATLAVEVLHLLESLAPIGNRNVITDTGAAALMARAAVETALLNVRINLGALLDRGLADSMSTHCTELSLRAHELCEAVMSVVLRAL
ncbi:MAG: glutamate formimidoyltransferase [Planctomycetota bacterium]